MAQKVWEHMLNNIIGDLVRLYREAKQYEDGSEEWQKRIFATTNLLKKVKHDINLNI